MLPVVERAVYVVTRQLSADQEIAHPTAMRKPNVANMASQVPKLVPWACVVQNSGNNKSHISYPTRVRELRLLTLSDSVARPPTSVTLAANLALAVVVT